MFGIFGSGRNKLKRALTRGAVIIDVRTVHEYDQGRLKGSINIPLERIAASIDRINGMEKPIICCSSGDSRSAAALKILKQSDINEVYDGGNWEKILLLQNSQ